MKKKVYNEEIDKLVKIFLGVAVIFVIFFVITYFVTNNKDITIPKPTYSNEIQFNEIIVGEIKTRKPSEYYVIVTKEDDDYTTAYAAYLEKYKEKTKIATYSVNLDNLFNKKYIGEKSDFVDNIVFSTSTLLKVKDGNIIEIYEGYTKIIEYLEGKIK